MCLDTIFCPNCTALLRTLYPPDVQEEQHDEDAALLYHAHVDVGGAKGTGEERLKGRRYVAGDAEYLVN